ncbi:DUF924 family protein [Roseomonas xinghualingensis]|uniref:DUF924 family protein n=1 Tax=Roseomonas xinghualingensis TaxID=2986475 RepID=UPI0021F11D88|nr:DUF924 family protein [Roseomonas sp. SXEYE001]MCV4210029.1 DUF924 domain-containing protein [Roseomonas sp. SXEYE001]
MRKALLDLWFGDEPDRYREVWFRPDAAFDATLRNSFGGVAERAAQGGFADWLAEPEGALALCLLLDQVPRNIHRGSARAFEADPLARTVARDAVLVRRHDLRLAPMQRIFLYLPFEHSEAMADQDLSVTLFEGLRDDPRAAAPGGVIDYAWRHRRVIARFGRFPHRNVALGRVNSEAEQDFLVKVGGF